MNEAVERAHRDGVLGSASLMVAGAAAADAVARARRLPGLRVGLHLVVVEGAAVLGRAAVPDLVGADGRFSGDQVGLAVRYFFSPRVRRQLRAEIAAQFASFAATGLRLDHANAHKHMHLHPTVGRMMIEEGVRHGLDWVRVPAEPPWVMRGLGERQGLGARALYAWTRVLRGQVRRAGLGMNDHVFGIAWSGHMVAERVVRLARVLPAGVSEVYFHPAVGMDAGMARVMPGYEHEGELAALLDGEVARSIGALPRTPPEDSRPLDT